MMRMLALVLFSMLLFSCKKDSPASSASQVKYECNCTPLLGATLTGTITYTSPNSTNNLGVLSNNTWSFTQNGWVLKSGDKLTANSNIQGNSNCTMYIYVDGVMKTFKNQAVQISGQNPTNNISVEYIVP